jgi:hypothetical protein
VTKRARIALVLVAIMFAAAAQMTSARSSSHAHVGGPHQSSLTVLTHHQDSAVVPVNQLVRRGRALAEMLSVPIAAVLAFVALLAVWFTASVRRRERLACAVVTYRRRGPPLLPHVI